MKCLNIKTRETIELAIFLADMETGRAYQVLTQEYGYTEAEAAEIIAGCSCRLPLSPRCEMTGYFTEIYGQIQSTVECSVRLGDRLADDALPEMSDHALIEFKNFPNDY